MINILSKKDFFRVHWGIIFPIVIFSIISLPSCVTTSQEELTNINDQIIALNRRVTKLQEGMDTKVDGDVDSRLKPIRHRQAEVGTEIDDLRKEIEILSGRIEETEHIVRRVVERDLGEQDAMQASMVQLSEKMTELERVVNYQHKYLGLEPLPAQKALQQDKGAVKQKEARLKPTSAPKAPKSKELDVYDQSLAFFKQEEYEAAMEGFRSFLKTYPKSNRADNAQFWIGECYMALKHYEQSILAYQQVIKKYPKGNKVPNAMLRQAKAFSMLGDKISTKLLLKRVVKNYPKSSEAQIARKRLKALE